jgi:Putative rRNA methylase
VNAQFSPFRPHLDLAHEYWKQIVLPGDIAIDATCGNGHDALFLCELMLKQEKKSQIYLIDKQPEAIQNSKERLRRQLSAEALTDIHFLQQCHSRFPEELTPSSVKLIVYNLGYLPGGDKQLTTYSQTTIESLQAAVTLIAAGGAISVTCYPGHPAGKIEEQAVLECASTLPPNVWSCCHHRWTNRKDAPSLILLQKIKYTTANL